MAPAKTGPTFPTRSCPSKPPSLPCPRPTPASQLHRLFAPLGYEIDTEAHPLDPTVPAWGDSRYFTLRLRHPARRLRDLLSHLYVLISVLDNDKHYYIGQAEANKLLHRGGDWLPQHPDREFITRRYLRNLREYVEPTLERLLAGEASPPSPLSQQEGELDASISKSSFDTDNSLPNLETNIKASSPSPWDRGLGGEIIVEQAEKQSLHDLRLDRVAEEIRRLGAKRVLDLGCGEGKLVRRLLKMPHVENILGMDVSHRELQRAHERLHIVEMPPKQRERITLVQGSRLYHDPRLSGYDAAAVVEVIEHLDESRLAAFEQVVFGRARPGAVLVTTPNADYNQRYETLSAGEFRHQDHRFEWTRAQFAAWAAGVAERHGYRVRVEALGPEAEEVGTPSQLAVFER
ncbi:Methyltransferase type 12 [Hymenobacter roseosalivarius DSM 11622]|uniref:Small RNA 2'-O-methyltransferase n=1 Tax=Hymenobacter roseosalivarius DSM 11622 TaxID=645990 RepID=A0A1W1VZL8_9BACT|nr:Methyltransferase type 12 [Hymenobacter roseosalivarius DSM 11622]